jgi:tRNA threonylcarbamoyladenosine biosynthesis protein TsaB
MPTIVPKSAAPSYNSNTENEPRHMRVVVLETSGAAGGIAVANQQGVLERAHLPAARRHARDLVPTLKDLLSRQNWKVADLDLLLVDRGPGSYTGLRVSVMTVKTLAFVANTPAVAMDSLEVLAAGAPPGERILPVIDAQQSMVYAALFSRTAADSLPSRLEETHIASGEDWLGSVRTGDVVTGPGAERWLDRLPKGCIVPDAENRQPSVDSLWRIGMHAFLAGRRDDPETLDPLYLRPSSAELKWKKLKLESRL